MKNELGQSDKYPVFRAKFFYIKTNVTKHWRNRLSGFYLPALLVLFPFAGKAQDLNDLQFELLDEEDGLSNHGVTQLALDSSGFLWAGSFDGLSRYDGHTFKVFRHNEADPNSPLRDDGHALFVDKKGTLWVSYSNGTLSVLDPYCQCFKHVWDQHNRPDQMPEVTLVIHHEDQNGVFWAAAWDFGLASFNPKTGQLAHFDLPDIHKEYPKAAQGAYNNVKDIYQSPNGLLWLATANGLYSFDPRSNKFTYKLFTPFDPQKSRNDYFNFILPDGDKGLWLSAWAGGVSYFDFATEKFTTYRYHPHDFRESIGNIVTGLAPKSPTELWVTTEDRGLGVFNHQSGTFRFGGELGITYQLLISKDGVMFLSTTEGIFKHNPYSRLFHFKTLPISKSQNNDDFVIADILEDPANQAVYFATQLGNGFCVLDKRTGKLKEFPVEVHPDRNESFMRVTNLHHDQKGRLWVFSKDYLYVFDKERQRLEKISQDNLAPESDIRPSFEKMVCSPDGDLWLVTSQGGLRKLDPETRQLSARVNPAGKPEEKPVTVEQVAWDRHGTMWVAGGGKLHCFDKATGRFFVPLDSSAQAPLANTILGMDTDKNGNIWIALRRTGLLRIDTQDPDKPTAKLFNRENGLPSVRISSMKIDRQQGNIWMPTLLGMVCMNPNDLTCRIFNQTVGMDKHVQWMQLISSEDGNFYITSRNKYCKVDFDVMNRALPLPQVYIDKFSVLNKERSGLFSSSSSITLKPSENVFSFEFGCIDLTNQALNKFAYKLEGWDADWVQAGTRRYAGYTNLNGGNYVFKVKVANSEGVWSEPIAVPVFIETPVHKRGWFMVMAALFFAALIYGLYLYRIRQIEHAERLRTEFNRQLAESRMEALRAQMNPHFIFNCLNSINRYIIKGDVKTSSLYLTRFAQLIRLILDNSKSKKVVLANELEALRLYVDMESLRFDHKFTFDIACDDDVDADQINVPPLLIQPYVENAIWHGLLHKDGNGHLSVRVSLEDESLLRCTITDNGIGRAKAAEYKSKNAPTRQSVGMKLTEERLHHASDASVQTGSQNIIDLFDENGQACGTQVVLTIPI